MRILVVDDDDILVDILQRSLSSQRHVVDVVQDGRMGWEYLQSGDYELVLLDVNLPGLDGVSLCEKMRAEGYATPILLMTAKNASEDRILGLDAGADDYLTKPLDLGELNARIRALSRRGEVATTNILEVNGLTLDPSTCQVSYQQQPIKLTAKEYGLLEIFLRNPERVFSRSQILDKIWTFDDPPLEESVKAHVKGLRKKLRKVGIADWIENVYGIGYRLNAKVDSDVEDSTFIEQEVDRKLEQMWLKYQAKMSDRMSVLQGMVAAIKDRQLSPEMQHNAERAAHKLAGVLGMFSKDTGTEIAREIETLLQDNKVLSQRQQEKLIVLVRDLDSLLALDTTAEEEKIVPSLLLISADKQLGDRLQQLAQTQSLAWHRVENIKEAKIWLQTNFVRAIAIELNLDRGDYLSLLAEFSQDYSNVPIIILSDSSNLSDRLLAMRKGVSRFLVKPVTSETVWQAVSQSLESQNATVASVLIVDDDSIFLGTISALLQPWGIKVHTSESPADFWQLLPAINPDLVILDVEMPEIDGIELCQTLRNDPTYQDLPVLFLTAKQDAKTIQQIFEIGGDDYIAKPVVGAELIARINNRLERSRLLHSLATKDRLTGLNNRSQSSREIDSLLLQSQTNNLPFCLTVLKITDLADINLKQGYLMGDRILAQWGKVIQAACRQDEITGYWGNGDFIIAIPNLDKTKSEEHLNELLATLRKQVFTSLEGKRFQATFNFAIVQSDQDDKTLHSLYQKCCQIIQ
ncbi:MAG: response regulator [Cyanobacteria bacterium P01_G01_bin.19]